MKNSGKKSEATSLRQKAIALQKSNPSKSGMQLSETDTLKLIHDLEVNQIELELQNKELKRAEVALRESEHKLRELLNNLDAGVVVHATDTSIILNNPRAAELLGLNDEQLKGKQAIDPEWKFVDESNSPLPFDEYPVNQILRTKEPIKNMLAGVVRAQNKDVVWLLVNGFPVLDGRGEIVEIIINFIDITERKNAEQDLKAALVKATESDRLKSAFLATISHELRTPLTAIIGFSEIINKDALPLKDIKDYMKKIYVSGNHLKTIVEDILDITLIESGIIKIIKKAVDIQSVLDDVYEIIKIEKQINNKDNIDLKLICPPEGNKQEILTDQSKLKQILINLLKNAIKFTHDGHVEYGYSYVKDEGKPMIQFYVEDTGIGIVDDKQEFIFDVFRQADESYTRMYGGTGIGLSLSKKLVENLGGKIWLRSKTGKGSTFYFTVPFDEIG